MVTAVQGRLNGTDLDNFYSWQIVAKHGLGCIWQHQAHDETVTSDSRTMDIMGDHVFRHSMSLATVLIALYASYDQARGVRHIVARLLYVRCTTSWIHFYRSRFWCVSSGLTTCLSPLYSLQGLTRTQSVLSLALV